MKNHTAWILKTVVLSGAYLIMLLALTAMATSCTFGSSSTSVPLWALTEVAPPLPAPSDTPPAAHVPTEETVSDPIREAQAKLLSLINQERAVHGFSPLIQDTLLMKAAAEHSRDMAQNDFFDHKGSDGSGPGERIERQGYAWTAYAENVGCRYETAEGVFRGWLDSSGHQQNMLRPDLKHIGIGLVCAASTGCGCHWTAVFASND